MFQQPIMQSPEGQEHWKTGRKLLAAVGPGPSAGQIIRWTAQLAHTVNAPWTVVYVETAAFLSEAAQANLRRSLDMARDLGAEIVTTADEDVVNAVLRVAAQRNMTEIVVGRSVEGTLRKRWQSEQHMRRLIRLAGSVAVHIVPVQGAGQIDGKPEILEGPKSPVLRHYIVAFSTVTALTILALIFNSPAVMRSMALVYLLSVVVLALFVPRGPTLFAGVLSLLVWDFFFTPPLFSLTLTSIDDLVYIVIALCLGHLTARLRAQKEAERARETRATALYLLTRDLVEGTTLDQVVEKAAHHLEEAFKGRAIVLLSDTGEANGFRPGTDCVLSPEDRQAAIWTLEHGRPSGRFTSEFSKSGFYFTPLAAGAAGSGVMALAIGQSFPPTLDQRHLMDAFGQQILLAVDRFRLQHASEKARLLLESERLSKTLLDSMSHEIHTPLAAIKSAAGTLAELTSASGGTERAMIAEIQEATERLNRLVGNVLEITRLGSGGVKPRLNECDVAELVNLTVAESEAELAGHPLTVEIAPDLPLVSMDFVLMQQSLANLLSNAARHTPKGTPVKIAAFVESDTLHLVVSDRGPGVAGNVLPRLFDKFYRGPKAATGGTGLGLSLVKGFVEAQGGRVTAENVPGGGLSFAIQLPVCHPSGQMQVAMPAKAYDSY